MLDKIKKWLINTWIFINCKIILYTIKKWFNDKLIPWLINSWMYIINITVLFIAYDTVSDAKIYPWTETILGLWLFFLLSYYIFWKLLGVEKMFNKKRG